MKARFFTAELSTWAHHQFCPSAAVESCGVFGFSNGGAFSIAGGADRIPESELSLRPIDRYSLWAGTREKPFHSTTVAVERVLMRHGVDCTRTERDATHDLRYRDAELPLAIRWAFPATKARWLPALWR